MSLFEQLPFGPLPARRPILMPPDPELEATLADPARAQVRLVGPIPRELRRVVALRPPRAGLARRLLAILLLIMIGGDPISAAVGLVHAMLPDGSPFYLPRAISAGIVAGIVVIAHWLFSRRAARERQREQDHDRVAV